LIARHDLENDTQGDFGSADFLCMSEIGLVVSDVPTQVAMFQTLFGLGVYKNSVAENFAAVGDGHGLFILSQRGRPWQPTTTAKGMVSPVRMTIAGPEERRSDIAQYPYTIHVVQERGEGKR
jgi:catechol-2,3-dioxygenase